MKQQGTHFIQLIVASVGGAGLIALFLSLGTPAQGGCGGELALEEGAATQQEGLRDGGPMAGVRGEANSGAVMTSEGGGCGDSPEGPSVRCCKSRGNGFELVARCRSIANDPNTGNPLPCRCTSTQVEDTDCPPTNWRVIASCECQKANGTWKEGESFSDCEIDPYVRE